MKRLFDLTFSFTGLLLMTPVLVIAAILIMLDSKGPVFFRQERVGRGGKLFKIYKFRTMIENSSRLGPAVTERNDIRITRLGKILRRLKLDELPQLINILKGEMSFVGPRPEVPSIVALYPENRREVLSVRPGIVGPGQIRWRDETEEYPEGVDTEKYYIEHILPAKLEVDLCYVKNRSFWRDLQLFFNGILVTLLGTKRARSIQDLS